MGQQAFIDKMVAIIRVNPAARTQKGMADALGESPRTLSRRLHHLEIPWPPIDRGWWEQLAREAAARPARADSWLITCRVTAATLSDAEAKLRTEDGVFIIEAKRLESGSAPALAWRVAPSDSP